MSIVGVIKGLIDLFRMFMDMADKARKAEAERKRQELEKALEDLKNAKTDEEKWDAQGRIVDNSR